MNRADAELPPITDWIAARLESVMQKVFLAIFVTTALACVTNDAPQGGHRRSAEEFLEVMQVEKAMTKMAAILADSMIKQNPQQADYNDVFFEWFDETMSWSKLRDRFVTIYMNAFSERELRELIAFYRTPTGRKSIESMPELMQKGAEIGNEAAMAGIADLEASIRARSAELATTPKPANLPQEPDPRGPRGASAPILGQVPSLRTPRSRRPRAPSAAASSAARTASPRATSRPRPRRSPC